MAGEVVIVTYYDCNPRKVGEVAIPTLTPSLFRRMKRQLQALGYTPGEVRRQRREDLYGGVYELGMWNGS